MSVVNENALNDWLRAPWCYPNPMRFHVYRVEEAPVPLWVAWPHAHQRYGPEAEWALQQSESRWFGKRVIALPKHAALASTWREAMDYVHGCGPPTPLEDVYPEYCGLRGWVGKR